MIIPQKKKHFGRICVRGSKSIRRTDMIRTPLRLSTRKNVFRVEQAWHDRILGEGTDVEVVKSATQLRVLLLGGVHRGLAPPPAAVPVVRGPPGQALLLLDEGDVGIHDPVNRI